ncbi:MAG: hypothetical protein ACOYXY_11085 [Thermodesulfobacteriota bacterium]
MRDDRLRLLDILEAIANIERYSSRGREAFDEDELMVKPQRTSPLISENGTRRSSGHAL